MKKLLLPAIILSALFGCANDTDTAEPALRIEAPVFEAVCADDRTRVFMAEEETETGLFRHYWNAGDAIAVYPNGSDIAAYYVTSDDGKQTARFTASAAPAEITSGTTYAVYPYSVAESIDADRKLSVVYPARQTYKTGSYGFNLMTAKSDDTILPFRNACAYLEFSLTGTDAVDKIVVESRNKELLAGTASLDLTGDEPKAELINNAAENNSFSVTLACNGIELSESEPTRFYIALPPTTFQSGFQVFITGISGASINKSASKVQKLDRNVVYPLKALALSSIRTPESSHIFYTTTDGEPAIPLDQTSQYWWVESNTHQAYENGYTLKLASWSTSDGELTLGTELFQNKENIATITLPDDIHVLVTGSLTGCSVRVINLGNITRFHENILHGCTNLVSIGKLNENLKEIPNTCFSDCFSLESINLENVEKIGLQAFKRCESLQTIELEQIKTIGESAFNYCINLYSITCKAEVPPSLGNNAFKDTHADLRIYVPADLVETYQEAEGWSDYASRIVPIEE